MCCTGIHERERLWVELIHLINYFTDQQSPHSAAVAEDLGLANLAKPFHEWNLKPFTSNVVTLKILSYVLSIVENNISRYSDYVALVLCLAILPLKVNTMGKVSKNKHSTGKLNLPQPWKQNQLVFEWGCNLLKGQESTSCCWPSNVFLYMICFWLFFMYALRVNEMLSSSVIWGNI